MNILDGKRILVTGVANEHSLAWGIAQALHAAGAELAFSCIPNNARRVRRLTAQLGVESPVITCNVQQEAEVHALFEQLDTLWEGKMHGLLHSMAYAKVEDLEGEFVRTPRDNFLLAAEVSAYSLVALTRGARPMLRAGQGSVITLTFAGSHRVVPNYNVMGPAKAALEASVIYLAADLGREGIRVNALSPGPIRTASAQAIKGLDLALDHMERISPLGRNLTKDDLGGPAVFLLSDMSKAITGQVLAVDAGISILTGR